MSCRTRPTVPGERLAGIVLYALVLAYAVLVAQQLRLGLLVGAVLVALYVLWRFLVAVEAIPTLIPLETGPMPAHPIVYVPVGRNPSVDETSEGYDELRAEIYARQMETTTRGDVSFYVERATGCDGPVLELACGTGRIYLEVLEQGVDIDGFDASEATLDILHEEAGERGLDPSVWQADMADFETDRDYELVICPFNALQHLLSVDEQLSALERIHDAVAPGGRFIFDVFVPRFDVICDTYGEWTTEEVSVDGTSHGLHTRTRLVDEVAQQFAVESKLLDPEGEEMGRSEHRLKMLPKREVELLARLSPFADWQPSGNFENRPIRDGDSVQVWELGR